MPEKLKHSALGGLAGFIAGFATLMITTGTYKEKVDTSISIIARHEARLNALEAAVSGIESMVNGNTAMLSEVRTDIKEILKRTE